MTQIYPSSLVVLDGGLGTTLEEQSSSDSRLWSTQQVIDNPNAIIEAHLSFMRAGSRIISTATYQASSETFKQAGYSEADASRTMIRGVQLADDARTSFLKDTPSADVRIALSLGPFGATLSPPQEYSGYYPPPYGPFSFSKAEASDITNAYGRPDIKHEEESINALSQFHLDRLVTFASDSATWEMIDIIAFETIPLLREVVAIRKAMSSLQNMIFSQGKKVVIKPWWISFVFPDGKSPQARFPGGANVTAHDLVHAAWSPATGRPTGGEQVHLLRPTGLGINCTSPEFILSLVEDMTSAVDFFRDTVPYTPWLVLYPNSSDVFDPDSRTWIAVPQKEGYWATNLSRTVHDIMHNYRGKWSGLVVGGCCRTNPSLISSLQKLLPSRAGS